MVAGWYKRRRVHDRYLSAMWTALDKERWQDRRSIPNSRPNAATRCLATRSLSKIGYNPTIRLVWL